MSSIMQILRRIGGAKATPTSGSAGQLALWKAGTAPTDAASLYAHDGAQWIELVDTGKHAVTVSETAPATPAVAALWYKSSTKELSTWDGAQWSHVAFVNVSNTFTKNQIIDVTDNANAALRITQKGTGDALRVEDEANPDATPFVVDANGNVSVGTTPNGTPKFEVAGKVWVQGSPAGGAVLEVAPDVAGGANGVTISASFLSGTYGPLYFKTSNQNRLTITKDGEFGIGGVHGTGIGAVIHARAAGGISGAFTDDVNSTLNIAHPSIGSIVFDGPGASTFNWKTGNIIQLTMLTSGALVSPPTYAITGTGSAVHVTSTGQLVRSSSSIKYKKDVEPLDAALTDKAIRELRPVWYRTKEPNGDDKAEWSHIGLIAEDVAKVEKRLVKYRTVELVADDAGNQIAKPLENPVPEDVDYARLSVLLLDHVQRLEKRIAVLEARP